jgi:hypothetical protein
MIENYIYMYHVQQFIVIPTYPESLTDTLSVEFASSTPMSRSAPIYSYSKSGPRQITIKLDLHRDLMTQVNKDVSNIPVSPGDDYVDTLIKQIQAIALPVYGATEKMVDPPIIACRFGNDIFIRGVVEGSVGVDYDLPIISGNKYAHVGVSFTIVEVDPYSAPQVMTSGSFRGFDASLERNVWTRAGNTRYVV